MGTSVLHIKTEIECKVFLFDEEKGIATLGKFFNLEVRKGEQDLLFVCTDDEYYKYHLLYNVEELDCDYNIVIETDCFVSTHELLTAKASDEEIANGIRDEYGVIYSRDGLHLLKCNSNISHYQIRQGCKVIRDWAFAFYHGSSISIPNTITHIGSYAFAECKKITSITIPTSIIHIGAYAFAYTKIESVICESSSFSYEDGCLIDVRQKKVLAYLSTESNAKIPSYITCIGDGAFMNTISRITLNNGLTSIGKNAFLGCTSLREITFPYSLKQIGYGAFSRTNIKNVNNLSPNIIYEDDFLIDMGSKALIACFSNEKKLELPKGITHIGSSAFNKDKYNYNPITITVPEGVTTIEDYAFVNCNNLNNITLPKTLKYIGSKAFDLCFKLARIKLPKGLEYIGWDAFSCCGSESFTISIPFGTRAHFEALLPEYQHEKIKEQPGRKKY